jgi:hypothetical protein
VIRVTEFVVVSIAIAEAFVVRLLRLRINRFTIRVSNGIHIKEVVQLLSRFNGEG